MRQRITTEDWVHPECGRHEVLFGHMTARSYDALPFETKRRGSARGGRVPVFIHARELRDIGRDQVDLLAALRELWGSYAR